MSSPELQYRKVVITGASAGIGEALARRLATSGITELVLVARRLDRLQAIQTDLTQAGGPSVRCVSADLSTEAGIEALIQAVPETDLLINNAGFGAFGPFQRVAADRQGDMIAVNCTAPVALAHHYLAGMINRGSGAVLNIASGQSFGAMPYMSTYAATKAFLLTWAEGVRAELKGTGVRMVTVCPGAIATEFNQAAAIPSGLGAISLVSESIDGLVHACMGAIASNRGITIPGVRNWIAVTLGRLTPRALSCWVLALVLRRSAEQAEPIAR